MANFMGMALARDIHLGRLLGAGRPPRGALLDGVRVYTSDQTHFSIARALDLLGFPPETLVVIPSDERFRLHGAPVAAAVARDRAAGLTPFAIAGVAGSTNTGSVDAVGELADVAAAEDLWLHVDAAYGGAARLSRARRGRVPDLDRADSVTVDPHKWFFQAYDIGGLLVRDGAHLGQVVRRPGARVLPRRRDAGRGGSAAPATTTTTTTATSSTSTSSASRAPAAGARSSSGCRGSTSAPTGSPGSSRPTTTSPRYLARRCAESDDFEAVPDVPELSVVCFRHLPGRPGCRDGPRRRPSSTPTRTDSSARSRSPATAG